MSYEADGKQRNFILGRGKAQTLLGGLDRIRAKNCHEGVKPGGVEK